MIHLGSFLRGSAVAFAFNTRDSDQAPITFAGTPRLRVLNADDLTEIIESGIVPVIDAGGVTGLHGATIDTSDVAYATVTELVVVIQAGTVDGGSVVGEAIRGFSLNAGVLPDDAISAGSLSAAALAAIGAEAGGLDADGVRAAVGLATANLDTQLTAIPTNAELATALDPLATAAEVTAAVAPLATAAGVTSATSPLATAAAVASLATAVDAVPTAIENADALLARNQKGGSNDAPSVSVALAGGLMRFSISGTTLTVLNGDGTTAFTRTISRAEADAIMSAAIPA